MSQPTSTQWPVLKRGSKGYDVRAAQYLLRSARDAWRTLAADGDYGPDTEEIVRAYQGFTGLTVDGIVGGMTWGRLTDGGSPASTVHSGDRGDAVSAAQTEMAKHKYLTTAQVDGVFGPETDAAVRRFQKDAAIADDGTVGPYTWQYLITHS